MRRTTYLVVLFLSTFSVGRSLTVHPRTNTRSWISPIKPSLSSPTPSSSSSSSVAFSVEDVVRELTNTEVQDMKKELWDIADRTDRGFRATVADRKKASEIIFDLARFNPSREPAKDYYYESSGSSSSSIPSPGLSGKWTLIYTDAPDITGLDGSRNPFATAKLGRIGQECTPPYIKNVIEWRRPDWAKDLPWSGTDQSRVLQKVVTSASSTPAKPLLVDLKVAGLELEAGKKMMTTADGNNNEDSNETGTTTTTQGNDLMSRIQKEGIPAGLLSLNPVDLKGPANPPFGQFEILYLDEELRVIRTGQNYLAVNRRLAPDEEWF